MTFRLTVIVLDYTESPSDEPGSYDLALPGEITKAAMN